MKAFTIPPHPPPLPIFKTCTYKTIGKVTIPIDVYLPAEADVARPPLMLFIHGGGWTGGNRTDYSRPLFHDFLSLGFIVTSMDYRLLPETAIEGQLEDIRDVEHWLRNRLALEVKMSYAGIQDDRIVVVGASAGAHLALLTVYLLSIVSLQLLTELSSLNFGPYRPRQSCPCTAQQTCINSRLFTATAWRSSISLCVLRSFLLQGQIMIIPQRSSQSHRGRMI